MANPKPDYIGTEWFEGDGSSVTRAADERARQGMTEAAEAVGAKPAVPQVYGGIGGYQYEVRGNDIYITGSKNKKVAQPIRVDPNTERGAKAYNAIIAELAPEGVTLQRVKVPAGEDWRAGIDPVARSNPAIGEREYANQVQADRLRSDRLRNSGRDWREGIDPAFLSNPAIGEMEATAAMPYANQVEADRLRLERLINNGRDWREGIDPAFPPSSMQRANQAQADMLAEQRKGAIASMYNRME